MNSKVSIIVPCFNQAQYLSEALQSLLEQTYLEWECIIVNDGSEDQTEKIANEWVEFDERFKYLFQENKGLCSARNLGIEYSKGEYILPLDADDKISRDYLYLAIQSFKKEPHLTLVYCKVEKFGDEKGLWELPNFSLLKLARNNMIICSAIFKKTDWERVGGYDPKMIHGLEDWEFWIAILKNGGSVKRLEEVGFFYRIRKGSMARIMNEEERKYSVEYVSTKHIEFILENYDVMQRKLKENEYLLNSEKFIFNIITNKFFGKKFLNINKQKLRK